ncbi:DNA alkylation repair protein [Microbacterium sp. HA-8]|uniref:DNA alkylation repair protein n=1 Tax=Microbacterium sp. HA-8 TaxID=3234200 RepID=UPI0038F76530
MDESPLTAAALAGAIDAHADPARAVVMQRFFKTGPEEYGEGDVFVGASVPAIRAAVGRHAGLPLTEIRELLASPVHEHRLAAVLVMVAQVERASRPRSRDDDVRHRLHDAYLQAAARGEIDSWDIVDSSAEILVGRWLRDQSEAVAFAELDRLAASTLLWERRIGMLATFAWIKAGDAEPTLRLARTLLEDPEPLMHKATGWMLREVGKRVDRGELMAFLDEHADAMPRTMLSYATEHLGPDERARLRAIPRRNPLTRRR